MKTPVPLLYRQLHEQLSQFIQPQDKPHLWGFAENLAALLLCESGCLSHWIKFLQHRDCQARSHMARLSYFVKNPRIDAEMFWQAGLVAVVAALLTGVYPAWRLSKMVVASAIREE